LGSRRRPRAHTGGAASPRRPAWPQPTRSAVALSPGKTCAVAGGARREGARGARRRSGGALGRRSETKAALPFPLNVVLFPVTFAWAILSSNLLVSLVYFAGAAKFWSGFRLTTYSSSTAVKIGLTAAWPILALANANYRKNFIKAIKG